MLSRLDVRGAREELIRQASAVVREIVSTPTDRPEAECKGRGIITCAGGYRYFTNAWILIKMLRYHGCTLPVQVWHFGSDEIDAGMRRVMGTLGVQFIDATRYPATAERRGWSMKAVAIARCSFQEVLFLDADNTVVRDPSFLFDLPSYRETGAIFWPDAKYADENDPLWKIFELPYVNEAKIESGQMVINKGACWEALHFAEKLNLRGDLFYRLAHGGKDLFRFAWRRVGKEYAMPEFPPQMLAAPDSYGEAQDAVLCQHDFSGDRLFQHRMFCKWDLIGENPWVGGCFFESKCHEFLHELKTRWDGRCGAKRKSANPAKVATKRSLVKNTWILEAPLSLVPTSDEQQPSNETDNISDNHLPAFVKAPQDVGKINFKARIPAKLKIDKKHKDERRPRVVREVKFAADGVIKTGGNDQTGYFWDLIESSGKAHLSLFSENGKIITLKRVNENSWEGRSVNEPTAARNITLRTIQYLHPQLAQASKPRLPRANRNQVLKALGKQVHVSCSSTSFGDHILAAYACTGLSRLGTQVIFHTPHVEWLSRISEPGLSFTKKERKSSRNLNYDYPNQLRYGLSRASWYAAVLHPLLKPAIPTIKLNGAIPRFPFGNYIILAPFRPFKDSEIDRNWQEVHWTRLANLLRQTGYELVAIGSTGQEATLLRTFSQTQVYWAVGNRAEWVMDALLGAAAYVGVDNDFTQLAALLNVKSVAIHSQLPGSFLWPYGKTRSMVPNTACTFCRWQPERGYLKSCVAGCSALATISPEAVAAMVLKLLPRAGMTSHSRKVFLEALSPNITGRQPRRDLSDMLK